MLRCALVAFAACSVVATAAAQGFPRQFPADALRGEMVVLQPPDITLDGKPARLAPGARIRSADNMLLLSGNVGDGGKRLVHYTVDPHGLVKDVWVLRDDEARLLWPRNAQEAAKLRFDDVERRWVKP
jgi:hypothetical protein